MNIEEHLRNHFEDEAAGLSVPAGSFDDVRRRGRRRRLGSAAGGAALALVLVGGVGLGVKLIGNNTDSGPGGTVATAAGTGETDQAAALDLASPEARTGAAPVDGTPLGSVEFTWSTVATLIPEGTQGWINGMNANQWGVVVFGSVTNPDDGATAPLIWTSRDGQNWVQADRIAGMDGTDYLNQMVAGPLGFVGLATGYDDASGRQTAKVVRSTDGKAWTASSLPSPGTADQAFSPGVLAASDEGIVVSGSIIANTSGPAVVVGKDGKTLTVDDNAGTLTITDDASGAVLYSGSAKEIWGSQNSDGSLDVRDPTGAVLMTIPYEEWDKAMADYLPGPAADGATVELAPATTSAPTSPDLPAPIPSGTVTVERDGKRLTLEQGRFRVEDAATGALLAEGTEDDLFRGPGPRFLDPATGDLLMSITWAEYDQAQQKAYDGYDWPQPIPVMYFSADATAWERVFDGADGAWVNTVAAGPAGFVATGSTADGRAIVWRSRDGRAWEEAAASFEGSVPQWIGAVYPYAGGYLAQAGDGVWGSPDGLAWTRVFTAGLYGDRLLSVDNLAAGSLGILLSGSTYPYTEPAPMVVTRDGETLTLDTLSGTVVITNTAGDVVFDQTFDPASSVTPSWIGEIGDGGFNVLDDNGTVIFTVTSADLQQAYGSTVTEDAAYQPERLLVFSADGTTWSKVGGLDLANTWTQGLGVTGSSLLVLVQDEMVDGETATAGSSGTAGGSAGSETVATSPAFPGSRLLIGTPAG